MSDLLASRRVLVVEDEMLIVIMIEDMLGDLGCQAIATAATVKQAMALIDEQRFDVAMLDMNLNGDDTYEVAEALTARGVPFVFSTGYIGHDMRAGYEDCPILKKPFRESDLAAILAGLLAR